MSQDEKIDYILKQVDKINRGIYGDTDNEVPGVIHRQLQLESDVKKLKENEKKRMWMAAGISFTLPLAGMWFKEKFKL